MANPHARTATRAAAATLAALAALAAGQPRAAEAPAPGAPCDGGPTAFAAEVLAVATRALPGRGFEAGADPAAVRRGSVPIQLDPLRARICSPTPPLPPERRVELVKAHLLSALKVLERPPGGLERDWYKATRQLMLQLVSEDLARLDPTLITGPFAPGVLVVVCIATDGSGGWEYVREADLAPWPKALLDRRQLLVTARMSFMGMAPISRLEGGDAPGRRFLVVDEKDGFEAARLLEGELRREVARRLGDPFYVAISSRYRLVMWSGANTQEFHAFAREQARRQWSEMPDALSPEVLRVYQYGKVEVVKAGEVIVPPPPPAPDPAGAPERSSP